MPWRGGCIGFGYPMFGVGFGGFGFLINLIIVFGILYFIFKFLSNTNLFSKTNSLNNSQNLEKEIQELRKSIKELEEKLKNQR